MREFGGKHGVPTGQETITALWPALVFTLAQSGPETLARVAQSYSGALCRSICSGSGHGWRTPALALADGRRLWLWPRVLETTLALGDPPCHVPPPRAYSVTSVSPSPGVIAPGLIFWGSNGTTPYKEWLRMPRASCPRC